MKLEIGLYARSKDGIGKIKNIVDKTIYIDGTNIYGLPMAYEKEQIINASNNIIDLIEVGDYVNGLLVMSNDYNFDKPIKIFSNLRFGKDDIKSIVTKEQFKANEYVVE